MPEITVSTPVTATVGLAPSDQSPGRTMRVTASGAITPGASRNGILGSAADAWSILNQGYIGGIFGIHLLDTADSGSIANTGTIAAGSVGIYLQGSGSVTNSGTITGSFAGILANGTLSLDNLATGTIGGGAASSGVFAGAGSIDNLGTIGGAGIYLAAGGTVSNAGSIAGTVNGIHVAGGALGLANLGTINGAGGDGVDLAGGGSVVNGGTILAESNGVVLAGGSIDNTGTIDATVYAIDFRFDPGAGIYLTAAGGSITNTGRIAGRFGVQSAGATSISNSGTIFGARTGIASAGALTLANSGAITATGVGYAGQPLYNAGLYFNGGQVTNSGTIAGVDWGLFATGPATIDNNGGIAATGNSTFFGSTGQAGVDLQGGGTVDNSGRIYGFEDGVAAATVIRNTGTIAGPHGDGVLAAIAYHSGVGLTVSNLGTITGTYGIQGADRATITNSGQIAGTDSGIAFGTATKLTNSGTITGNGEATTKTAYSTSGVYLARGTITNTGLISGAGYGVDLAGNGGLVASTLANQGTITSPAIAVGIGGGATVVNAGTISGPIALAVTSGSATLVEQPGASIAGTIAIGANTTLDATGTIAGPGTISLATGALFSLAGSATPTLMFQGTGATMDLLTPGTPIGPIAGFAATDIIDLAGLGTANVVPQGNTLDITPTVGTPFDLAFAAGTDMSALTVTPDSFGNLLIGHS
jgi:hypothetical protein